MYHAVELPVAQSRESELVFHFGIGRVRHGILHCALVDLRMARLVCPQRSASGAIGSNTSNQAKSLCILRSVYRMVQSGYSGL